MMCRLRAGTVLSEQVNSGVAPTLRSAVKHWNVEKADDFLVQRTWCKLTG